MTISDVQPTSLATEYLFERRRANAAEAERDRRADHAAYLEREVASLRRQLGESEKRRTNAEDKVRRALLLKSWRNEDGKEFVFAEELWATLEPEMWAAGHG